MKRVINPVVTELVISRSRFIAYLEPMQTLEALEERLRELRKAHHKANHVCYAYRFGLERPEGHFSDDGEPSQTAGLPMYQILSGEDITDSAIFVVRYFGGIKLGTGGLVRAYSDSLKQAIQAADFQNIQSSQKYRLNYGYPYHDAIQNLLSEQPSQEPSYLESITWTVYFDDPSLLDQLRDLTEGSIVIDALGPVFIGASKRGTVELGGCDEKEN